jgi:hypothetical protein
MDINHHIRDLHNLTTLYILTHTANYLARNQPKFYNYSDLIYDPVDNSKRTDPKSFKVQNNFSNPVDVTKKLDK